MSDNKGIMNSFLFVDNEGEPESYFIVMGDMSMYRLKKEFKGIYTKLMNEFWNDDFSEWNYIDFYDELAGRLAELSIILNEPDIVYHDTVI